MSLGFPIRLATKSSRIIKSQKTVQLTPRTSSRSSTFASQRNTKSRRPPQPRPSSSTSSQPPQLPSPQWNRNSTFCTSLRFLNWTANGIITICVLLWIRDHHIEIQHVRGSSMAPTLSPHAHETGVDDWVVILPYRERPPRKPKKVEDAEVTESDDPLSGALQRGDVVTFWKPHKPEEMGIKRVVALEGDIVFPVRGYAVVRKERAEGEGRLRDQMDGLGEEGEEGEGRVVVPYGHVWLEGDNWRKSLDSNDFGPISKSLIMGRAIWVWRSWFRFERIGDERLKKEQGHRSRVVEGRSEIPEPFLE